MLAFQCSYIDEGKADSAISILKYYDDHARKNNLLTQRYLANQNITRIHFEYDRAAKGLAAYDSLNFIIQQGTYNGVTKKLVADLRFYYTAYALWLNGQTVQALQKLAEYDQLRGNPDEASRILKAKIFLKEKKPKEALAFLEDCDRDNPYVQFWMGLCYEASNQKEEAKGLYNSIVLRNEMQELDFHLVRKRAVTKLLKY